jgi:hypothetical protein
MIPSAVILFAGSELHATHTNPTIAIKEKVKRLSMVETSSGVQGLIEKRPCRTIREESYIDCREG